MDLAIVISTDDTEFSALAFKNNLRSDIETVAKLGYNGVELAIRNPADVNAVEILELTQRYDLKVVALGTGQAYIQEGLSFAHPDKNIRNQAVERIMQQINLAQRLDSKVIIGLLRGKVEHGQDLVHCGNWMKECFWQCLTFAKEKEVTLLIEPLNRYETNLINTCEEAKKLIDELGFCNFKILIDSFHMNIEEVSVERAIKDYAKYIGHVHVADSNRWAPGLGHFDFAAMIIELEMIGYDGYLSAEIMPLPDPGTAIQQTISYLKPMIFNLKIAHSQNK